MKRTFSAVLALLMVMSLSFMSLAESPQSISGPYKLDEDEKVDMAYGTIDGESVEPGSKIYFALYDANGDLIRDEKPTGTIVKEVDSETNWVSSYKIVKMSANDSDNRYGYFLQLSLRRSSSTRYDTEQNELFGTTGVGDATIDYSIMVQKTVADDDVITADPQLFDFEYYSSSEEKFEFDEFGDSYMIVNGSRESKPITMSADSLYNADIAEKYPNVNMDFFNGESDRFNSSVTVYLECGAYDYLYKVDGDSLEEMDYDIEDGFFVFTTRELESYVMTDAELNVQSGGSSDTSTGNGSSNSGSTNTTSGSAGSENSGSSNSGGSSTNVPYNPATGAAA